MITKNHKKCADNLQEMSKIFSRNMKLRIQDGETPAQAMGLMIADLGIFNGMTLDVMAQIFLKKDHIEQDLKALMQDLLEMMANGLRYTIENKVRYEKN